ncbi:MAG: hypothetical protein PWQ82_1036 [Thermosediminibacterales bacterium]|nr:hypothetical protein [Thermosediminibacterales bacterium]
MRTVNQGRLTIKIWSDDVDEGAMRQAVNLSNLPFAYSHIALMPDVHEGYGMPIGGVLASDGMIIPNAVGVDIGCGVVAVKTDIKEITTEQIKKVLAKARKLIPMGFKHNNKPQQWEGFNNAPDIKIINQEIESARYQLGSLGSGNHFYSIEQGDDGHIWLMVHSGSRNIGLKVAHYYNKLAKKINERLKIVPKDYDLACLPLDSAEGKEYYTAMEFCLKFAKANREHILARFYDSFSQVTGSKKIEQKIDIHHNYASVENHFGKDVIIHRKGATSAKKGELGIIPGSMGTSSYVVEGLGNPESFKSCSHGAGRAISRKKANQTINEEMANKAMKDIVFTGWHGDYSEAPQAYKDIEKVMFNQRDLVKPLIRLTPLGVMKG